VRVCIGVPNPEGTANTGERKFVLRTSLLDVVGEALIHLPCSSVSVRVCVCGCMMYKYRAT